MGHAADWTVRISVSAEEGVTKATATLRTADGSSVTGRGTARKHPRDPEVPEIGDELAAGRALADVAGQLVRAAAEEIVELDPQQARERPGARLWL